MFQRLNIYNSYPEYISPGSIRAIQFYVLGGEETNKISSVRIENKDLFQGNIPVRGGVNDARMGTTELNYDCETCQNTKNICPGHLGSIDLKYPVKNPMFRERLLRWLKACCFNCGRPVLQKVISAPKKNLLNEYAKHSKNISQCPHCGAAHDKVVKDKKIGSIFYKEKVVGGRVARQVFYNHQIADAVRRIPDSVVLKLGKPLCSHPKKFILNSLIASPVTIRPDIRRIGSGRNSTNDTTTFLKSIVSINNKIQDDNIIDTLDRHNKSSDDTAANHLIRACTNLDQHVYDMIRGTSSATQNKTVSMSNKPLTSIMRRLPQKHGRFRKNLMGKRVVYAARSVITGDPMMPLNVVGIPMYVATTIQIPETVRSYNIEKLTAIYMNRRNVYPGWSRIIKAINGQSYGVSRFPQNYQLKDGDIIFRDMIDGDVVCFGRQPSLLYSNLSGFVVRVLERGQTFRLNVSACSWFNADFDGDAMLIIAPTSISARTEVKNMSAAKNWFISYKDQKPTVGLFQDSLIGAAKITDDNVRMDKWHAMQCFAHIDTTFSRNVCFDKEFYTGRELISMIIPQINLIGSRPTFYMPQFAAYVNYNPNDIKVVINRGKLTSGVLDKKTVGQNSSGSIFQVINDAYGPEVAMENIFAMQQCIHKYQGYQGFTVGILDIMLSNKTILKIKENVAKKLHDVEKITENYNNKKLYAPIGRTVESYYEELVVAALDPGDDFIIPILEDVNIKNNGLVELVLHGSKGKLPNIVSINAALGQQDINGSRPAKTFGQQRTSPYFPRYDKSPEANGYISQSFREGIPSKTFLFVAQEARHGLTNNALTTSVSGAQNRIAIKNLESLIVNYTRSLVLNNKIIQLLYAGDGIDPRKLVSVKFPSVSISHNEFTAKYKSSMADVPAKFQNKNVEKLLADEFNTLLEDRDYYRQTFLRMENYDFKYVFTNQWMSPVNIYKIIEDTKYNNKHLLKKNSLNPITLIEKVNKLCNNLAYGYLNENLERQQAPLPEYLVKSTKLLCILLRSHLSYKELSNQNITDNVLDIILVEARMKFNLSLVDYGASMGIIAAQCISEPLTQYVLDSKHRTGIGGSSKTNPIQRYKEILGVKPTSKMKNPSMRLRVKKEFETNKAAVQEIANHIEMLKVEKFISRAQIFFETYGKPIHPKYKHESKLIEEFEKRFFGLAPPTDLLNWCIRFELDREEMIMKSMELDTFVFAIKKKFPELHIVYTAESSPEYIMRCYIQSSLFKQWKPNKSTQEVINIMINYMHDIKKNIIRGVDGVHAAEVVEHLHSREEKDGSITLNKIYAIGTNGSNFAGIFDIEGLDLYTSTTDSLEETNNIFGIEIARDSIINELKIALEDISPIHCSLYADIMTASGCLISIEKTGVQRREDKNVLLKASSSSPIQVFEDAAENGILNEIYGVSAPLCLGRAPNIGTLYTNVLVDCDFIDENKKTLESQFNNLN